METGSVDDLEPLLGPESVCLWDVNQVAYPAKSTGNEKMQGELGNKLVQHAKRIEKLEHLPPYQTETVREVGREVRDLDKNVADILKEHNGTFDPSANPEQATSLLVNHLAMRRDKRTLLAYHKTRTDKIEQMVWDGKTVSDIADQKNAGAKGKGKGADLGNGEGSSSSLSPEEEEYMRGYGELVGAFKGQYSEIDLGGSLTPPRDLFVDVRVLKDAGPIETEYGTINLTKNSQFHVRLGDIEHLIAQGYLQIVG